MKQSTFKKELSASGKNGTFKGEVIATLNSYKQTITRTHAVTHDDYTRDVWTHKLEATVNGEFYSGEKGIETESGLLLASKALIEKVQKKLESLATQVPEKSFTDKMQELFS